MNVSQISSEYECNFFISASVIQLLCVCFVHFLFLLFSSTFYNIFPINTHRIASYLLSTFTSLYILFFISAVISKPAYIFALYCLMSISSIFFTYSVWFNIFVLKSNGLSSWVKVSSWHKEHGCLIFLSIFLHCYYVQEKYNCSNMSWCASCNAETIFLN